MHTIDRTGRSTEPLLAGSGEGTNWRPMLTVLFPCLNEAASVARCVREARQAIDDAGLAGEVLVVDNGSTDGSPLLAQAAGARVVYEERPGYGSALTTGFAAATGEVIVMADADLTYPLDKLPALLGPLLRGEADIVYGGRLEAATRQTMPWLHRYIGTPALTFLLSRACGKLGLRDSQTGFRAFRRTTILELDLRSPGMESNAEMLIKASQAGLRMVEVPTGYRPRAGESKLNTFSDGWRNLRTILLLAPEMLLIWPGVAGVTVGVAMALMSFVSPRGVAVGSLRWQPVFFSNIVMILGVLALLAGAVLAHTSSVVEKKVQHRYAFVSDRTFLRRCCSYGSLTAALGFVIDVSLLLNWGAGNSAPPRGLALASLGQSLLIIGVVIAVFGFINGLFVRRPQAIHSVKPSASEAETPVSSAR